MARGVDAAGIRLIFVTHSIPVVWSKFSPFDSVPRSTRPHQPRTVTPAGWYSSRGDPGNRSQL